MVVIITPTELLTYAERSGTVEGMTGTDSALSDAVSRATDRVRQAALNDYTAESFESLSVTTAPPEMRDHTLALALDILTRADAGRPDSVAVSAASAAKWLGFLAGGTTHYDQSPGAVLVKRGTFGEVNYAPFTRKLDDPFSLTR